MTGECYGSDCEICGEHCASICGCDPYDFDKCQKHREVFPKEEGCPLCEDELLGPEGETD